MLGKIHLTRIKYANNRVINTTAPTTYTGLTTKDIKNIPKIKKPITNNHPVNPSRYKAITKAVKTINDPTSGCNKTNIPGTPIKINAITNDLLSLILKSGLAT